MNSTGAASVVVVFAFLLIFYGVLFGFLIAQYIMTSLGLHRIATKRKIDNPWLAWIPYANYWTIGSIVDEYDARNGLQRKWRVVLLGLSILVMAVMVVYYVVFFVVYFAMFMGLAANPNPSESDVLGIFVCFIPMFLAILLAVLAAYGLQYSAAVCYYKIFESIVPEKSVKYFLLFVMIPLAGPICLLKCSKICPELEEAPALPTPPSADFTPDINE